MKIYLRRIFPHDISHEVSVRGDVVEEFFGGIKRNLRFSRRGIPGVNYSVDINEARDYRLGGDFKKLLKDSGGVFVDEILSIRKLDSSYDVEIIKMMDPRYATYNKLFSAERDNGNDRHQILIADEGIVGDRTENNARTGAENVLLYGVPGVGKSFEIQKNYLKNASRYQYERVIFHPEYTYADFVGQILPKTSTNDDGKDKLEYEFTPGPFTKILKKAVEKPSMYFYLVIEEINRGNAPAIFGEIFQLLDRKELGKCLESEVGESEYGITNFEVAKSVYGDQNHEVRIPGNLYILATMNTADQNVFTLDTAFQRRWNMRHIKNNVMSAKHANEQIVGTSVTWGSFALVINELVVEANAGMMASEDKRLGAYFAKSNDLVPEKFSEKVLKYLWDDAFRINRDEVFKDEFKSLDSVIEKYEQTEEDRLEAVLRLSVYEKMAARAVEETNTDET